MNARTIDRLTWAPRPPLRPHRLPDAHGGIGAADDELAHLQNRVAGKPDLRPVLEPRECLTHRITLGGGS